MKKALALLAVLALVAAAPAEAYHRSSRSSDSDINVSVSNSAYVSNDVDTSASTGGNTANGGSASNSTLGGSIDDADDYNRAGNRSAAAAGNGGVIVTGEAISTSGVTNTVNASDVKVTASCGCKNIDDVNVSVRNHAGVRNDVDTKAKTGYNTTNGGAASNSTLGGSIDDVDDANKAGNSSYAHGGNGGSISTGRADSLAQVVTTVNPTVIRVRR